MAQQHRNAALCVITLIVMSIARPAFAQTDRPIEPAQRELYEQATQAFREHRFAAAYGRFVRLAEAGHAPSARLALVMVQHGNSLFGSEWSASPGQQQRWTALCVNAARSHFHFQEGGRVE
jgi:hypothetical protein